MPSMMVATLGIALPEIKQSFSLSAVEAGSLFSVMMAIAAITSGIAGRLADKSDPKTVLIAGLTLFVARILRRRHQQRSLTALLVARRYRNRLRIHRAFFVCSHV
jgi:MFS family permease